MPSRQVRSFSFIPGRWLRNATFAHIRIKMRRMQTPRRTPTLSWLHFPCHDVRVWVHSLHMWEPNLLSVWEAINTNAVGIVANWSYKPYKDTSTTAAGGEGGDTVVACWNKQRIRCQGEITSPRHLLWEQSPVSMLLWRNTLLTARSLWVYSVLKGDILSLGHCCLVWGLLCITAWFRTACHSLVWNYCPIKPVWNNIQWERWRHCYSHRNKTTLSVICHWMASVRLSQTHRLIYFLLQAPIQRYHSG